jgi:urease accessory protein
MPGFSGHLRLSAARRENDDGRTFLAEQSFRAPFHVSKPYWDGRVLHVQVVNATAGILAGDALDLAVRVRTGASLLVSTPAATRAFMMRRGIAECRQQFTVAAGGWLEYAPEPLCPHRDSDYAQTTRLEVASGGEVFFVDALAPGRVGRGESWAWRRLRVGLDVRLADQPVLREWLDAPGEAVGATAAFHGTPRGWMATVVILSARLDPDDPVWDRVRALHDGDARVGLTRLRSAGWVARVLASSGQQLRDVLRALREQLAEKLPQLRTDLRKV